MVEQKDYVSCNEKKTDRRNTCKMTKRCRGGGCGWKQMKSRHGNQNR